MLNNFISSNILAEFPFDTTSEQKILIQQLSEFIVSPDSDKLFLLKGYAGTGKTTVVSALVKALKKMKQQPVLLAPTGRAAKVLSGYSETSAYTIHKKIYIQKSMADFRFNLAKNLHKNTIFIVDEASMISNSGLEGAFGSGRLLDDLIKYVYSGDGCALLLLGDTAQLPPVEQIQSPALDKEELATYGLNVTELTLTNVVRQAIESGILYQATALRNNLSEGSTNVHPLLDLTSHKDVKRIKGNELIETLQQYYDKIGVEETMVITRSNKRANLYNNGIRSQVMLKEEQVSTGDLLMVTKNNYFWSKSYQDIDFIANGDILEVARIGRHYEMYGFHFAEITLRSLDYNWEIDARVWLDSLSSESPKQMSELNNQLFQRVGEDYPEIKNRRKLVKKILENDFFNSLQVKFAYAVTCHKAQGGQWKRVFIDYSGYPGQTYDDEYYRWLYTAITRATEQVILINFPDEWFAKQ